MSVQVPLYVRSRVNDIIEYRAKQEEYQHLDFIAGVFTNTRFSDDALHYGEHANLHLMAWDYPKGKGLKDYVEKYFIYPVTILKDLNLKEKQYLLNHKIVLCYQLVAQKEILQEMGMNSRKQKNVLNELEQISKSTPFF